jgi:hypothetical protein
MLSSDARIRYAVVFLFVCLAAMAMQGCGLVGAGGVAYLIYTQIEEDVPKPTVLSITPNVAEEQGGTAATISGADFEDDAEVFVGGVAASAVTVLSSAQISVTLPPQTTGVHDLEVANASNKKAMLPASVTYVDTVAPAAVTNLAAAAGAQPDQVVLTWTAVGDNGNTGTAAAYDIRVDTSPILNDTDFSAAPAATLSSPVSPSGAGTSETATVVSLGPDTYYFAVKVQDEVPNISSLSNVPECDIAPPGTVRDLSAFRATSEHNFILVFTAPADDGDDTASGAPQSLQIKYSHLPMVRDAEFQAAPALVFTASPAAAGSEQTVLVTVPTAEYEQDVHNDKIYFALRSVDEAGNVSGISRNAAEIVYEKQGMLPLGTPPTDTELAASAYDRTGRRMVFYGGMNSSGDSNDLYVLRLVGNGYGRWTRIDGASWLGTGPATARRGATLVYDPPSNRFVLFGGIAGNTALNECFFLSIPPDASSATWTDQSGLLNAPSTRWGHSAVYDPVRGRMILYGGTSGALYRQTARFLNLAAGSETWDPPGAVMPNSPGPLAEHGAVFDTRHNRMLVFGGTDGSVLFNRVHQLDFTGSASGAWTNLTSGVAGTAPSIRKGAACVWDPFNARMLVLGGMRTGATDIYHNQVFAFDTARASTGRWHNLRQKNGSFRSLARTAAIFDRENFRVVAFGGEDGSAQRDDFYCLFSYPLNIPSEWTQPQTTTTPSAVSWSAMTALPLDRKVLLYGGGKASGDSNETWLFDLDAREEDAWYQPVINTPPPFRRGHTIVYAPSPGRALLFGGVHTGPPIIYWKTVFAFNGQTEAWTQQTPTGDGLLAPRAGHCAVYDPFQNRMIIYGGTDGSSIFSDTWELRVSTTSLDWTDLGITPPANAQRRYHSAVFDPVGRRMIVFGGEDSGGLLSDTLVLSLGASPTWNSLKTVGQAPPAMAGHTAYYDHANRRMVVLGGQTGPATLNTTVFGLHLGSGSEAMWFKLGDAGAVSPRTLAAATWDPIGQRLVGFGGEDLAGVRMSDTLLFGAAEPQPPVSCEKLSPTGTAPGPRAGHAADTIVGADSLIVFGGRDGGGTLHNDVFVLGGLTRPGTETWTPVPVTGPPPPFPQPREGALAVHNTLLNILYVFGGFNGTQLLNDVWALPLGGGSPQWTRLHDGMTLPVPSARAYCTGVYKYVVLAQSIVIFGGDTVSGPVADVWEFDLGTNTWTDRTAAMSNPVASQTGRAPAARSRAGYAPGWLGSAFYFHGGRGASSDLSDLWLISTWTWDWFELPDTGTQTAPSINSHFLFLRPYHKGICLTGGYDTAALKDGWAFRNRYSPLEGWWFRADQNPPMIGIYQHKGFYDDVNQRLIFFGGLDESNNPFPDTWAVQFHKHAGGR